jgi:hypothetical protein
MIVCESTAHVYYPVQSRLQGVIRGTGRIRYVRGFLLVKPRGVVERNCTSSDMARAER